MKQISIIALLFAFLTIRAEVPVGSWRTHLMYSSVTQVAESAEKVYGLSDGALYSYDKEDNSIEQYSKINGLSDNKISLIAYSPENKMLVIGYDNSNIDLLTDDGKIINIPDIKNLTVGYDKTINRIEFSGKKAYLSMAYGISVVNLTKFEISDSYPYRIKTFSTAIYNGKIYAATDRGIYYAPTNSNLIDFSNWSLYNSVIIKDFELYNGKLAALAYSSQILTIDGSGINIIYTSSYNLKNIFATGTSLIAYGNTQITIFRDLINQNTFLTSNLYCASSLSSDNSIWIASGENGINKTNITTTGLSTESLNIKPEGPLANSPYRMKFSGNKLMVVGGGAWDDRFNVKGMIMFYENEKWSSINVDTLDVPYGARDFVDIIEDPKETGHIYVASYGEGLYEFRNKALVKRHTYDNSGLESIFSTNPNYVRTDALCIDKDGNLFVGNEEIPNTLKCYTKDKQWITFTYSDLAKKPGLIQLIQSKKGVYWLVNGRVNSGIFAFNTNGTLNTQVDDKYIYRSEFIYLDNLEEKSFKANNYYCIAEDKNGAMWVGTSAGPIVFNNTSKVFETTFTCSRVKVPRNDGTNLADYLLENEKIKAIAVDGANRKWIGTEASGVYLVSENGQQTIHHFTAENSPLISNRIMSIAIHPNTGEVFFGTDKGITAYRSEAIEGKKSFSDVYAFPNPVRPEYNGLITITGLKYESTVRITDIAGNSIFEGTSKGGQITWNGRNRSGARVSTGVYLVYAATSDGLEGVVTKILMVK